MLTGAEEKKEYFNHYWQTRDLPSADARSRQRAELVQSLLEKPESGRLLDVGCGRGGVIRYLTDHGYNISGCDLASDTIGSLQGEGYDVFIFDIEQDGLPGIYRGILCLEVVQQIYDPKTALIKLSKAIENGGYLIISIPNEFHFWSRLCLLLGISHLGHFDESHIRLFTPDRARQLFERAGLMVEKYIPVSLIPPGNRLLGWLGGIAARIMPSLFSLSQIYRLKVK